MNLEKFLHDFRFRNFNIKRDRPRASYSYGYGLPDIASYYVDRDEVFELEIDKRELENLADFVERADHVLGKEAQEHYLRSKYTAVADAYSKYQILLELCR